MRIARILGHVTLNRRLPELPGGALLLAEALDPAGLERYRAEGQAQRGAAMPESLVVFDQLGAGRDDLIAVSEGREAAMPFHPTLVPCDAYNAAILDRLTVSSPGRDDD